MLENHDDVIVHSLSPGLSTWRRHLAFVEKMAPHILPPKILVSTSIVRWNRKGAGLVGRIFMLSRTVQRFISGFFKFPLPAAAPQTGGNQRFATLSRSGSPTNGAGMLSSAIWWFQISRQSAYQRSVAGAWQRCLCPGACCQNHSHVSVACWDWTLQGWLEQ